MDDLNNREGQAIKEISKEKLEWMKEVGMNEFKKPMKYYVGLNNVFSEEYIKNTPLEVLKARCNKTMLASSECIDNSSTR